MSRPPYCSIRCLRHTLECPNSRTLTTAAPVAEPTSGFGPHLQAAVAYFSGVGRLGKRTIGWFLADLYAITISRLHSWHKPSK